jgi:hypothetical protein
MENLQATSIVCHTLKTRSRLVLFLMENLGLSVSGIEDYTLFTGRYYSSIELAQTLDNQKLSAEVAFTLYTLVAQIPQTKPVT